MKKFLIMAAVATFAAVTASAQNYMVVNTENIFKALPEYTKAVEEIDAAAKQYQSNIDDAYAQLEQMYESYMSQKSSMSQNGRQQREETILNNEKKIMEYQESVFGEKGKMTQLQQDKLEPFQKKVMETITKYASDNGYSLVLDVATNPLVVYYDPAVDKTQQIIAILK